MKIYIASSWKNQYAIVLLTEKLREKGHEVLSFVENNLGEGHSAEKPMPFEDWLQTDQARKSFIYDTNGATKSNLVIYLAPSGKDAAAEIGAAWACGIPVLGLWAKGEDFGLMRKMIEWHGTLDDLFNAIKNYDRS